MSMEILGLVDRQLRPLRRQVAQILRIGKVLKCTDDLQVEVALSQLEVLPQVKVLSLNNLQKAPKIDDLVLVFCPDGDQRQAVVLAVIGSNQLAQMGETVLSQNESKITLKDESLKLKNTKSIYEVLTEIVSLIDQVGANGYVSVTGQAVASIMAPINTSSVKKSLEVFK